MPLHEDYLPAINDCLKALVDLKLIPANRPRDENNIYDFVNEMDPSVKYAMAVHNFVTYFKKVNGTKDIFLLRKEIATLENFFYRTNIQTEESYFALKALVAYLDKIDLDRYADTIPAIVRNRDTFQKGLNHLKNNQTEFKKTMLDKLYDFLTQYALMNAQRDVGSIEVSLEEQVDKETFAIENSRLLEKYEEQLRHLRAVLDQKVKDEEILESRSQQLEAKESEESQHRKQCYEVYQKMVSALEAQIVKVKASLKDYLPKKQIPDHIADLLQQDQAYQSEVSQLKDLTALFKKLQDDIRVEKMHEVTPEHYCEFGFSEQTIIKLNGLFNKAQKEFDSFLSNMFSIKARTAYRVALLDAMNDRVKILKPNIDAAKENSPNRFIHVQPSLMTNIEGTRNALIEKIKKWQIECAVDNRNFISRWWNPRPDRLGHYITAIGRAIHNIDNPQGGLREDPNIQLVGLIRTLIQYAKDNREKISKTMSSSQCDHTMSVLNLVVNYQNQFDMLEKMSKVTTIADSSTKGIAEQLSISVLPKQLKADPSKVILSEQPVITGITLELKINELKTLLRESKVDERMQSECEYLIEEAEDLALYSPKDDATINETTRDEIMFNQTRMRLKLSNLISTIRDSKPSKVRNVGPAVNLILPSAELEPFTPSEEESSLSESLLMDSFSSEAGELQDASTPETLAASSLHFGQSR